MLAGAFCAGVWAAVLTGVFSYRTKRPEFPAIAEAAARASPEVAELILEIHETLASLADEFPDTPETLEVVAGAHFRLDLPDEAVRYSHQCLELDPEFGMAYHWLGVVARQKGHHAEAADHFRRAIELKAESPRLVVDLADALTKAGRPEEAIPVLLEDLRAHPGSTATLIVLGETYARCKQYKEARATLEAAIRGAPDYTTAYLALATACARLGDEAKSKEYLQQFRKLKDRDEQFHRESLKAPDDLAELRLDAAHTRATAAKVYLLHGRFKPAEEHLLRACELDPKQWEFRQALAWLYEQQERMDEALKLLADFAAAVPEDSKAQMFLGALQARMGRPDLAAESYRKAIALAPGQGMGYAALADLYLQAGRPEKLPEAKSLAQKAVDLQPEAQHYFLLALANRRLGDLPAARSAIDRAVALEPGNPEYLRAQDSLRPGAQR